MLNITQVPRIKVITVIGVGGIGSWLVDPLARLCKTVNFLHECPIRLIDGDTFSASNLNRQSCIPLNERKYKADVLASRLRSIYSNITPACTYLTSSNVEFELKLPEYMEDFGYSLVVMCVDKHSSRRVICDGLENNLTSNFLLVNTGNELNTGTIQVWGRFGRTYVGLDPRLDPLIRDASTNEVPVEGAGCEAVRSNTSETPQQKLATNFLVASSTFALIENLALTGKCPTEIQIDSRMSISRPFDPLDISALNSQLSPDLFDSLKDDLKEIENAAP